MIGTKTAKILGVVAILLMWIGARPDVGYGWSWNPFSSASTTETRSKKPISKTAQKSPSTWSKVTSGTKGFFTKVGNTLTGKKSAPKKTAKPQYAFPKSRVQKKEESKSWFSSWFQPKEPEKPKTVSEWMDRSKRPEL